MVVLVVLALFNIGLVYYMFRELKNHQNVVMELVIKAEGSLYSQNKETLEKLSKQIKQIPKEITVKNVLKLP